MLTTRLPHNPGRHVLHRLPPCPEPNPWHGDLFTVTLQLQLLQMMSLLPKSEGFNPP